jgi:hypothetical protein
MNIVNSSYLYVIPPVGLHYHACCMPKIHKGGECLQLSLPGLPRGRPTDGLILPPLETVPPPFQTPHPSVGVGQRGRRKHCLSATITYSIRR